MLTRLARAALVAAIVLATTPLPARACCPAPAPGRNVQIADQDVLIVWNPSTKMEHFVRRATFANRAVQVPNDLDEIIKAIELYS